MAHGPQTPIHWPIWMYLDTSEAGRASYCTLYENKLLNNHLLPLTNTLEPDQESTLQACSRFSKLQYSVTVGRLMSNIHGTGNPTRKACAHSEELDDTLPTCPTVYQGLSDPFWTKPPTDAVLNESMYPTGSCLCRQILCKTLWQQGYRYLLTTVVGRRCGGVIEFECKRDKDTFFSHRPGFDLLARLVADLTWASLSRIALPLRIQAFIPPTHIRLAGDVSSRLLEPSRTSGYHVETLILLQNKKEG